MAPKSVCEPSSGLRKLLPATGVIWALRAQSWKKSPKMSSQGLSAPRSKKSRTESKKSQNRLFFNYFDSFSTPFSTFWVPGPRGPGNSFSDSFSNFGPKGPNDPCSRARESQAPDSFPECSRNVLVQRTPKGGAKRGGGQNLTRKPPRGKQSVSDPPHLGTFCPPPPIPFLLVSPLEMPRISLS